MRTFLRVAVLAIAFLPLAGAQAQSQGSNQAADNALNWAAAGGPASRSSTICPQRPPRSARCTTAS